MSSVAGAKRCTKCGEVKSADDFYIKIKATGRRLGRCKACHNKGTTGYYQANIEEGRRKRNEYGKAKRIANPGHARAKDKEARERNKEKLKARDKQYRAANKEKVAARKKAYNAANAEKVRKSRAAYNAANKDRIAAYNRANKERLAAYHKARYPAKKEELAAKHATYRVANKEKVKAYNDAWRAANPEKSRIAVINRRCRLLNAKGSHTEQEWLALKARYGNKCLCCGKPETEAKLHQDHVVPLIKGGSNDIGNIQCLCRMCNSKKAAKETDYRPKELRTA
jgi:hypothetical protein